MNKQDGTLAYPIDAGCDAIGVGRSKFYQLANAGAFPIRKIGKRSVVLKTDLEAFLNALPAVQKKVSVAA